MKTMQKIAQSDFSDETVQMLIQVAKPHYGFCIKDYYFCKSVYCVYEKSLDYQYFDKNSQPLFGEIQRSRQKENQCEHLDSRINFKKLGLLTSEIAKKLNCEAFGIDLLLSEKDNSLIVVDLNIFPGYATIDHPQIRNNLERYLNTQLICKKEQHFDYYQQNFNFSKRQLMTIDLDSVKIHQGFINRAVPVTCIGEKVKNGQYRVGSKGRCGVSEKTKVCDYKFKGQEFYGRMIELVFESSQQEEDDDTAYIVTDYTMQKSEDNHNFIVLDFHSFVSIFDLLEENFIVKLMR